jgi:hypothetical protein
MPACAGMTVFTEKTALKKSRHPREGGGPIFFQKLKRGNVNESILTIFLKACFGLAYCRRYNKTDGEDYGHEYIGLKPFRFDLPRCSQWIV